MVEACLEITFSRGNYAATTFGTFSFDDIKLLGKNISEIKSSKNEETKTRFLTYKMAFDESETSTPRIIEAHASMAGIYPKIQTVKIDSVHVDFGSGLVTKSAFKLGLLAILWIAERIEL